MYLRVRWTIPTENIIFILIVQILKILIFNQKSLTITPYDKLTRFPSNFCKEH